MTNASRRKENVSELVSKENPDVFLPFPELSIYLFSSKEQRTTSEISNLYNTQEANSASFTPREG